MRESQGAKLLSRTLRSSAVAGCNVRLSHPAIFFELFSAKPNLKAKLMPMSWECLGWTGPTTDRMKAGGREAEVKR